MQCFNFLKLKMEIIPAWHIFSFHCRCRDSWNEITDWSPKSCVILYITWWDWTPRSWESSCFRVYKSFKVIVKIERFWSFYFNFGQKLWYRKFKSEKPKRVTMLVSLLLFIYISQLFNTFLIFYIYLSGFLSFE